MAAQGLRTLFVIPDRFHGRGKVMFAFNGDGTYLCTAGSNGLVHIFDRHGAQVCEIVLETKAQCLALEWDKDGESVVILQSGVERVAVWELATRAVTYVDTGMRDVSFAKWSKTGPQLAIASARGGLVIFRKDTRKKLHITGKHSKAVLCGDWSRDNRLALGGADNMLTLSSAEGDTLEQIELKYAPVSMQFATQKVDNVRGRGGAAAAAEAPDTTVSVNMSGKTVLLYNLTDPDHPVELAFQARYGRIVAYRWFGDGYMMLGFSEGYVVVISTHVKEIGEELFSGKFHRDSLDDIACSVTAQRAASAGGNLIKLIDMAGWKEVKNEFASVDAAHGPIDTLQWTPDGQILAAATRSGHVYGFLARVPTLVDAWSSRVAYMSSLREVSIVDAADGEAALTSPSITVPVAVEPAFLALGAEHVAVGMNNRVWYHRITVDEGAGGAPMRRSSSGSRGPGALVADRDYVGTVDDVKLGVAHAAVLCAGRLYVHTIEVPPGSSSSDTKVLPENEAGPKVTCAAIAGEFLFYGTSAGAVEVFSLSDGCVLPTCIYRGDGTHGVKWLAPNPLGTRVVVVNTANQAFIYNPIDNKVLQLPAFPEGTARVLFDILDHNAFVASNGREMATYLYTPVAMTGATATQLGALEIQANGDMVVEPLTTPLQSGCIPCSVMNGQVAVYTQGGAMTSVVLATHSALHRSGRVTTDSLKAAFAQNVALLRLQAAWEIACTVNDRSCWLALSGKAMETLNVELAQRVYRRLGDAGMVAALESVTKLEDRNAVAGHMALLFGETALAQELFLTSSQPLAALDMRKDLLQWETALKLAETLSPAQVPAISVELAKQLEFRGEYSQALSMYQSAQMRATVSERADAATAAKLDASIAGGIARMTLRLGDVRRGVQLASDSNDKTLCRECAAILESMKQFSEAAQLYKRAELWDKAVSILMQTKNFAAVAPLMQYITTPKLHSAYAKAKEVAKEYAEAVKAYEKARDMDAVVRILIENLGQPERAATIVRQTRSSEGAQMIAKYCVSVGDFRGAIEFLLLAKKRDEAFALACTHNEMGLYAQALRISLAATSTGTDPTALMSAAATGATAATAALAEVQLPTDECVRIAGFLESKSEWVQAGDFYAECGQFQKALKLYLQCGDSAIDKAIEVVGKAKSDAVTVALIDFLMGETDGVPKDPRFIFKVYMALGNFPQAAKTALIIAKQEQDLGNYKVAHSILYETYRDLEAHSIRVPQELLRSLTLLHSYLIVKKLVRAENHEAAAHMMLRCAKNVSKFPAHVVSILTLTVIECQRAGLKRSAFEYAAMLVRPEYRDSVEEKYRKKIEQLVRRPSTEEAEEPLAPCPFCDTPTPAYELSCTSCKNTVPFCIITGRHMTIEDCSFCPTCRSPALYTSLAAHLTADTTCTMCGANIAPAAISLHPDPHAFLRKLAGAGTDEETTPPASGSASASAT